MAWKPITTLKALWVNGFKPTGNDYTDLLDTCGRNYKTYTALISQSGTNAPTATVLQNDFSGAIVWTRNSAGDYLGTLTGAFTQNKTFMISGGTVNVPFGGSINSHAYLFWNDVNSIGLWAGEASGLGGSNLADDLLVFTAIEIRVFN